MFMYNLRHSPPYFTCKMNFVDAQPLHHCELTYNQPVILYITVKKEKGKWSSKRDGPRPLLISSWKDVKLKSWEGYIVMEIYGLIRKLVLGVPNILWLWVFALALMLGLFNFV